MEVGNTYDTESYLPELPGLTWEIRKGRCVYDGYQRGWGLQYGGLEEKIRNDALFIEATSISQDRAIITGPNQMNLYLILRFFLDKIPFGHIIEYGAYKGGNAIFMAYVAGKLYPGMKVLALDSFKGAPYSDKRVDAHNAGDFSDADVEEVQRRIDELKLHNLELIKGNFEDTSDAVLRKAGKISLAHIDCDIAPAVRYSYESVKPYMVEGGYLVLDDATAASCIGVTEVVEDLLIRRDGFNSEQIWPQFVFRIFHKQV